MEYRCHCSFGGTQVLEDGVTKVHYYIGFGTYWKLVYELRTFDEWRTCYILMGNDGTVIIVSKLQLKNFTNVEEEWEENELPKNIAKCGLSEVDMLRMDYIEKHLVTKTCANCKFCKKYLGKSKRPFFCHCEIKECTFLLDDAKNCEYFKKINYAEWRIRNADY